MVIYVICFPVSYKLNTSVSSVYVLKRISEAFCIRQGQHNNRSPLDVGFDFWFWNVNVKVFSNSGICLCTSKWNSGICT